MSRTQILLPRTTFPKFCQQCGSPIINIDRALVVNPEGRKREPGLCLHYKPLRPETDPAIPELPEGMTREEGRVCHWQTWVSPGSVIVVLAFWKAPDGRLYICVEKRGIEPGLHQYGFPGGHVEPGDGGPETGEKECLEEVGLVIDPRELEYVAQVPNPINTLLLTFFGIVLTSETPPVLKPDGIEVLKATWHPVDEPLNWAWPWQAQVAAAYAARLPS